MPLRICVVGIELPIDDSEYVDLSERRSLSEFDIVVFCPLFNTSLSTYERYAGLPSVSHDTASRYFTQANHWKDEIRTALRQRKLVVVSGCPIEEFYYDTGSFQFSGTGKNARKTVHVDKTSNYHCLASIPITPIEKTGARLVKGNHAADFPGLASFFVGRDSYDVVVQNAAKPILVLPDGSGRTASFVSASHDNLIFVPWIRADGDWEEDDHDDEGNLQSVWTDTAWTAGAQLTAALVEACRAVRSGVGEALPQWTLDEQFRSKRRQTIEIDLQTIAAQRAELDARSADLAQEIAKEDRWLALLSGKGSGLEAAVREALQLLGFEVSEYKDEQHQFDAVFEADGQRYIGECEGKDNRQIDVGKLSQAMRCVAEDLALRDDGEVAVGVLFGNGHRLIPLGDRGAPFTEKVLSAAAQQGIRLIATPDLFRITLAIRDGATRDFATRCRDAIKNSAGGLIQFPTE